MKDAAIFVGTVLALAFVHTVLHGPPDDIDMTQFWVVAGTVTILAAIARANGDTQ